MADDIDTEGLEELRELFPAMAASEHPDAQRFARWLHYELRPALERRERVIWPGTLAEFNEMVVAAVRAVQQ